MSRKHKTVEELLEKTIPQIFLERVRDSEKEIAFRYKDLGVYKEVTWSDYWRQVEALAYGLMELGLEQGDAVAIMGDPCAEWMYSDMAVISAGGIDFGVYTTSSIGEVEYVIRTGEAKFFIAENQEYIDKILSIIDHLPKISKVIVVDIRATFMYEHSQLISFSEVQELGFKRKKRYPDELAQRIKQINPNDPAFLVFTSGTSGPPKPAILSHQNIVIGNALSAGEIFQDLWEHEHRSVSQLSLAHVFERGPTLYWPLLFPLIPHIGESLQYMQETLYEVQPTIVYGVPRIWEKIAAQALVGIEGSSWIKKLFYRWAMSLGQNYIQHNMRGEKPSFLSRLSHWMAVQMAFRHILHRLGLCKVKYAFSAGAPLPLATQRLWQTWGIDLVNVYGATEAGGFISSERPGFPRAAGGKPVSFTKVSLTDDGEVMVSGPGVFRGYWKDEEATRMAKKDGWLFTGDIGEYTEDGGIILIDRKKDIMITSGGKNITPSLIETALKASPYISEAVLYADGRKFPAALIEIDFETVSDWARRNKILYTGFTSLAAHPKVSELIEKEVEKANQLFGRVEQVKKFRIIPKELNPEEGDTTATRKIKRKTMYQLFKDLVEEMYA